MLNRLRLRITLLTSLLTGAVLLAAFLFAFFITRQQYITSRQEAFFTAVAQLQYQWERFDQLGDSWMAELEGQNEMQVELWENGRPLLYSLRASEERKDLFQQVRETAAQLGLDTSTPPLTSPAGQSADFTITWEGHSYRCAVRLEGSSGAQWRVLMAVQSLDTQQDYLFRLGSIFGLAAMAGWAVLALISWFVAGRAVQPVSLAMEQQQQFLSAAGHELRTPLAAVRANAGAALCQPGQAEKYLRVIDSETQRMGGLVDDLLLLSAGASARTRFRRSPLALDTLLLDFAESMEPLAKGKGLRLAVHLPDTAVPQVEGDQYRLQQLLTILLDNAMRYAPRGSQIELGLENHPGLVVLWVADRGPGVPDSRKKEIFRRFVTTARQEEGSQHYGLGLAVASELAALHEGRLWVEDTPGGGATFKLELPA